MAKEPLVEGEGKREVVDAPARRFRAAIIGGHAIKHIYISGLLAIILPEIKLALSYSSTQIGALASAQQFSGWASTVGSGYLGDRYVQKTALLLGLSLGLVGVAYLIMAATSDFVVLFVGMLVMGLGVSMYHPPALGALARRFRQRRALAISLHGAGGSIGEVLGPMLTAGMIGLLLWQDVLLAASLPVLLSALGLYLVLSQRGRSQEGGSVISPGEYMRSLLAMLSQRALLLIFLATGLRTAGQTIVNVFLPIYLREDLAYSAGLVAVYVALAQAAGIGSQPLMGFLSDRFGHKRILLPALVLMAVLLGLIPVADGKIQLAIVVFLLGAFLFSLHAILISAASELAKENMQATAVSLVYAASFIGSVAPTAAGVLADAAGTEATFALGFVLVLLAAVALAGARLPQRGAPAAAG